ncbi:MAG: hypothetical protein LW860_20470 [Xanthomonadaceae bacterium]|nr:hypothetical protein [Xanthomonadaceae bacterium]
MHFVVPLARLLGRRTRYRITDFHPECLFAALGRRPAWGAPLQWLTDAWRRRVDVVEVLGEDQAERLRESGVDPSRMVLVRDPSPVPFDGAQPPADPPPELGGRPVVLYSGNWGVAHDEATFVGAFAELVRADPAAAPGLWLNATGARADRVEAECRRLGLPVARTKPVPLARLAGVLRAADVHLITLSDAFVGYVLPSKVYACIESGRPVLFIGSRRSDVHRLCTARVPVAHYRQAEVGDVAGAARALRELLAAARAGGAA